MKAHMTGKEFSFEIEDDEMLCLMRAENLATFPSLAERLAGVTGVRSVTYDGHFGPQIVVGFQLGEDWEAVGFEDARDLIEIHLQQCERFLIYVGDTADDVRGKSLLHAGDGFVLCNSASEQKDLGVSLHFLEGDGRQTKWFTDGAAQQFRELAVLGDARRIKAIVAKHIDLDPPQQRYGH